ncbi:hypothetical protein GCM10027285_27470 [Oleiagrimonas citrea]
MASIGGGVKVLATACFGAAVDVVAAFAGTAAVDDAALVDAEGCEDPEQAASARAKAGAQACIECIIRFMASLPWR